MSMTLAAGIESQLHKSRLRILIVGAGIAGATLAALLRQRGECPVLIERATKEEDGGYMLGLLPLGARVLNGLGLTQTYEDNSLPMKTYEMYGGNQNLIQSYPLAPLLEKFGSWRGIARGDLLKILRKSAGPIQYNTIVTNITEADSRLMATFDDGSSAEFDLIVGADGIHSSIRKMILTDEEVEHFDTGWGGYVIWGYPEDFTVDTYSEIWAAGWGIGLYPVQGKVGMFLAGRDAVLSQTNAADYAAQLESKLSEGVFLKALKSRNPNEPGFYWKMEDFRSKTWSRGRTILLGDAATAFLPTAGVGASAAMDSAAALADELSRAGRNHIHYALDLYIKRQRDRVEISEKNSRDLARLMFVNTRSTAWARDKLMEFYSLKHLVADISKVMEGD